MGFTKVTVSHQYNTLDGKAVKISDKITIAVLDPLNPVQPTSGKTVLSVGSSVDIVWKGGAQPWILNPETHFHQLKTEDESLIEIEEKKSAKIPKNFYVYSVTCSKLGETKLNLMVGNSASKSLPKPLVLSSEVVVICTEPERLQLEAKPERPEGPCPLVANTGRIAALCYKNLKIDLAVFDSLGRKLDNYSSVDISWQNSDDTLSEIQQEIGKWI